MKNRIYDAHGGDNCIFGYIKDGYFIYTDIDYKFELCGEVVKQYTNQTGGMCMVDYIELDNGIVYYLTDEGISTYPTVKHFDDEQEHGHGYNNFEPENTYIDQLDYDTIELEDMHEKAYQLWIISENKSKKVK